MCLQYRSFENTMGKGGIAPFPTVFSICLENLLPLSRKLKLSSATSLSLEEFAEGQNFRLYQHDKIYAAQTWIFSLKRVENIKGKGDSAGYQNFHHSPHYVFKKPSLSGY